MNIWLTRDTYTPENEFCWNNALAHSFLPLSVVPSFPTDGCWDPRWIPQATCFSPEPAASPPGWASSSPSFPTRSPWARQLVLPWPFLGTSMDTLWLCQQFAIENGHWNSGFSIKNMGIFHSFLYVYQRVVDDVDVFLSKTLVESQHEFLTENFLDLPQVKIESPPEMDSCP